MNGENGISTGGQCNCRFPRPVKFLPEIVQQKFDDCQHHDGFPNRIGKSLPGYKKELPCLARNFLCLYAPMSGGEQYHEDGQVDSQIIQIGHFAEYRPPVSIHTSKSNKIRDRDIRYEHLRNTSCFW